MQAGPNKFVVMTALVVSALASPCLVKAQEAKVFYDVSTVKPHAAGDQNVDWRSGKDSFRANNVNLIDFIASAWDVRPDQTAGGPAWVIEDHWDMTGKVTEADPETIQKLSKDEVLWMQQKFLSDRFHLKVHLESRTGPVYDMIPAKSGIKLQPLPASADGTPPTRGGINVRASEGGVTLLARGIGIESLIKNVALNMHKTVINKTAIPADALFDFTLHFAQDTGMGASAQSDAPPMREALEQQLGLHLEPNRGSIQTVVIDSIERPTAN